MHFNANLVLAAALIALALAFPRIGDRWLSRLELYGSRFAKRRLIAVLSLLLGAVLIRLAVLPWFPVPIPEVNDEFSYLLAGDTFSHGRLTNPPHPMSLFFETFHVLQHPTYSSKYPPAQGGALALGEMLGCPWFGVLISVAGMIAAITWMLQAWLPPQWALLGGLFALLRLGMVSYWIDSYWGGAIAATGGALVLGGFRRLIHSYRRRHALAMGIGAALLACSRPLEGFIFCVPIAMMTAMRLVSKKGPRLQTAIRQVLAPIACVLLALVFFLGYYNWRVTKDPLLFPEVLAQRTYDNMPLFAWQKPAPPLQLSNLQMTAFHEARHERYDGSFAKWRSRSSERLGYWRYFPGSGLMMAFASLPWMIPDRRIRPLWLVLCCSGIGLLAVNYFEFHYAAPIVPLLLTLIVQALRHLRQWKWRGRPVGLGLSRVVVVALVANVAVLGWSATRETGGMERWNAARARIVTELQRTPGSHLVIVRYSDRHEPDDEWVYNSADIDSSKVVWAREVAGQNTQPLLDYFHGRTVWLLEADASPVELRLVTSR